MPSVSHKSLPSPISRPDHDQAGIQRKAAEQGIPYQSLIYGLIHQFVEEQLATRADR